MSEPDKKRCPNCNKLFGRRILSNGDLEYPSNFKKKRFCSIICGSVAAAARRKMAQDAEQRA